MENTLYTAIDAENGVNVNVYKCENGYAISVSCIEDGYETVPFVQYAKTLDEAMTIADQLAA